VVNGVMVRPVEYQYQVNFVGVDTAERPGKLTSPKLTAIGDELNVSPRGEGLYFIDDIKIVAGMLPWDRYPQVSVEVRYADPAHNIHLAETFLLTKAAPEATWKRFRMDPNLSDYEVKMTFFAVDHADVVFDWKTTDQER